MPDDNEVNHPTPPAMTNHPASPWSDSLRQQTRQAIEEIRLTPDGHLHFKHSTLGYAYATLDELIQERLVLHPKAGGEVYPFDDVDDLLQAGWAVD